MNPFLNIIRIFAEKSCLKQGLFCCKKAHNYQVISQ